MSIRSAFDAGHPLYTYAGDQKPGEVAGQGLDQFGAEWYVLARTAPVAAPVIADERELVGQHIRQRVEVAAISRRSHDQQHRRPCTRIS